jgi:bifunctional UDP-N-acetylglucosamine pyrophosphorylase/glucosamine-1-phosphate N-acetyltransferase
MKPKSTSVILAAGQGTRMKSSLPKVLHQVAGKPMVWHALHTSSQVTNTNPVLIIGNGAERVQETVGDAARFVMQEKRLGTGHAVMQAETLLRDQTDYVLVTSADMPLLTAETLSTLLETQIRNEDGPLTMLIVVNPNPRGFGRVVRGAAGEVLAIVEEAVATDEQKKITELNAGAYCFRASWLWDALHRIELSPKGEYYITDLVAIAVREGLRVAAHTTHDTAEAIGVNTRVHLSDAETAMRKRINAAWMNQGVTMIDPATTYIDAEVILAPDIVLHPNTILRGKTHIETGCEIGPNTTLDDVRVGAKSLLPHVSIRDKTLTPSTQLSPFTTL